MHLRLFVVDPLIARHRHIESFGRRQCDLPPGSQLSLRSRIGGHHFESHSIEQELQTFVGFRWRDFKNFRTHDIFRYKRIIVHPQLKF